MPRAEIMEAEHRVPYMYLVSGSKANSPADLGICGPPQDNIISTHCPPL